MSESDLKKDILQSESKFNKRFCALSKDNIQEFAQSKNQYRFIRRKDGTIFVGLQDISMHRDLLTLAGYVIDDDQYRSDIVDAGFLFPLAIDRLAVMGKSEQFSNKFEANFDEARTGTLDRMRELYQELAPNVSVSDIRSTP